MRYIIGIDNGVTGTVSVIDTLNPKGGLFFKTPVMKVRSHTKKVQHFQRLDHVKFKRLLRPFAGKATAMMENPMTNPNRSSVSQRTADRCLEAQQVILEQLNITYEPVLAQDWQKKYFGKDVKGQALKQASFDMTMDLFPQHSAVIIKHGDGDGLMIAKYLMDTNGK